MERLYPFFYQYDVQPQDDALSEDSGRGVLATVMVFAESDEVGRARAGRYIAAKKFTIKAVKRVLLIEPHHVTALTGVLKQVYLQAEQQGIAACFDSWSVKGKAETSW